MAVLCGFRSGSGFTPIRYEKVLLLSFAIAATLLTPLRSAASNQAGAGDAELSKLLDNAENGSLNAQLRLAEMYALGRTGEVNYFEAARWYHRAADQGDPASQNTLGVYYLTGRGVVKDEPEAAHWFQRAAASGFPLAQHNLGIMYLNGWGIGKDPQYGLDLLMRAANGGLAVSQYNIALQYLKGDLLPADPEMGIRWLKKAAHQGLPSANALLGIVYEKGQGTKADLSKALKFYREASDQGSPIAQNNLARFYMEGRGVPKDTREAMRLFHASAQQGNGQSYLNLAFCSIKGCDSVVDPVAAYSWYLSAQTAGIEIPQAYRDAFARLSTQFTESQIKKAQSDSQTWIAQHPAADPRAPVQLSHAPGVATAVNRRTETIDKNDEVLNTLWPRPPFDQVPRLPDRNSVH